MKPSPSVGRWLCVCPLPDHDGDQNPAVVWQEADGAISFECDAGCGSYDLHEWLYPPSPAPQEPTRFGLQPIAVLLSEQIPETEWLISPWLEKSSIAALVARLAMVSNARRYSGRQSG